MDRHCVTLPGKTTTRVQLRGGKVLGRRVRAADEELAAAAIEDLRNNPPPRSGPGFCGLCLLPERICRCEPPEPLSDAEEEAAAAEGLPT